jgi:hypothetical protein
MRTSVCSAGWTCWLAAFCLGGSGVAQQSKTPDDLPTFGTTVVIPSGLRGDIYLVRKNTTILPDFDRLKLKPAGAIWTTTLNIPPRQWREGFPGVTKRNEWFAINYTGRFWIEKPGQYKFALLSDDGSQLYIDDQLVIDNDCQHSPDVRTAKITLGGGVHRIRVPYFQGPRDCIALILAVAGPEEPWRIFTTDEFKPPPNLDDWKYTATGSLAIGPDHDVSSLGVDELLRAVSSRAAHALTNGCAVYPPVHNCGN